MPSVRTSLRWLVLGACLLGLPFAPGGCRKDGNTTAPGNKPIAKLTPQDLRSTLESLGFEAVTATTSENGGHSNTTVAGLKEHPEGIRGPDGKKRLRVIVSLHAWPNQQTDRDPNPGKDSVAFRREGRHTLMVELSNDDREEAERILARLSR